MKVLITTDVYHTIINGVAVSVHNLYSGLKALGCDVRILTLSQTSESYVENDVYYIKSMSLKIYPDARATFSFNNPLLAEIIEWAPDIIHSQCEFFTFIFARKLARLLNIPIVHTYHTLYEHYTHYFCPNKTLGKRIVATGSRFICNQADTVIAPTSKTENMLKHYGVNTPITVLPTGLDLDKLQKAVDKAEMIALKSSLNIPLNAPVMITLGRLAREKNIDFLVQQMQNPKIHSLNVHLVIAGDGPDKLRLQKMCKEMNLEDVVHFTGLVAPEDVYKYYHLGDIFVSASISETQGLTYIEALACGLPILCLKDECLQSILYPGKNGWFFESSDDFVEHLQHFCYTGISESMCNNAREAATFFSKESFALRALCLYSDTIFRYHTISVFRLPMLRLIHQKRV